MSELNKQIGMRIKNRRKELRMTQKELGQKIGCAEITIRQYESGRNAPKIDTRIALAKALDISYAALFDPDATELASMLPVVGVEVENDPDPQKTQSEQDRIRIEDAALDLTAILTKSGLVTQVGNMYYLHDENRKAVKLETDDFQSYQRHQLANISRFHYNYVDILRDTGE